MWLLSPAPSVFPGKAVVPDIDSEHCVYFIKRHVTFSALFCVHEAEITGGVCRGVLTPCQCFHIEILISDRTVNRWANWMQSMIALLHATDPDHYHEPRADLEGQRGSALCTVPWEQGYVLVCSGLLQAPQDARSVNGNEDAEGTLSLSDQMN